MKFIVLLLLLVPVHTFAATSVTVTNSGTSVTSHTSASASTGGNTGSHEEKGSASASASSYISVDGEGGDVHTVVETETNGDIQHVERHETSAPGEPVLVELHQTALASSSGSSTLEEEEGEVRSILKTILAFLRSIPFFLFK